MKYLIKSIVIFVSICLAAVANAEPSYSGEIVFGNRYLTFGSGSLLSEEKTVQASMNAEWENGFFVNLWLSRPLNRHVPKSDFANENDYVAGWNGEVGYWKVGASLTYFDEPRLGEFKAGDIWYTSLKASHGLGHVELDLNYDTYTPMKDSGFEGGHLIAAGISKKMEFAERVTVSGFAKLAYDDGGFGFSKGFLANYGGEISWKVNKHLSVIAPRVNAYLPFMSDARKSDAMWWIGASWNL